MNHYECIARVIRYLDEHHLTQPSLEELAEVAGLSESYFHRLFHQWAGVTPKDFLQCLTVEFAKNQLLESKTVLETAWDVGLSGAGRLHDLLVTLEAASPGEMKNKGAGIQMDWGFAESPFGNCSIGWNARGICHIAFHDLEETKSEPLELSEQWSGARRRRDDPGAASLVSDIFNADRKQKLELKAFVRGTAFQVKVWRALLRIPAGSMMSYGQIAQILGDRGASRAVGAACGSNSIGFLIPCHRVIRETGVIKGYRWGTSRKQAMLAWEALKSGRSKIES